MNGLNKERGLLLNLINVKRYNQITEINEFLINLLSSSNLNAEGLKSLNLKSNEIKNELVYFNKSLVSNYDLFLNKFKLSQPFDLHNVIKYSSLIVTKKRFHLKIPDDYYIAYVNEGERFISLHLNQIFIYLKSKNNQYYKMLIINQHGMTLHSKESEIEYEKNYTHRIDVAPSSIVRLYQKGNEEYFIEVYDFKLNMIYQFKLDSSYSKNYILSHNEMAFQSHKDHNRILVFNLTSYKFDSINVNTQNSMNTFGDEYQHNHLIYLNEAKLYFIKPNKEYKYDKIVIMDRLEKGVLANISLNPRINRSSIRFDVNSKLYDFDEANITKVYYIYYTYLNIYDSDGVFLYKMTLPKHFDSFFLSLKNKIVYNRKLIGNLIEYDEY